MTAVKIQKARGKKTFVIKKSLKLENYKNSLEVTQLDNKINYLEKKEINIASL